MACSCPSLEDCSSSTHAPSTSIDSQCEMVESPRDGPCTSESASSLPWFWVIQAVASCKEIHISTLKDLIDVAPVVQEDFCEKTREMIALRCLEDVFDSAHRTDCDDDDAASLDSRVQFDFSSSCEDVLQQILDEVPLSNLKTAGAELLKWDVFPFIMHKRATIKCDLEQLKESISEGTHPYTNYLREISGLVHQNGSYPVHVNDNECSDLSEKDNGNYTYCANMEAKENSVSVILENGNESLKESLLDKITPSKRSRVESADEHIMGYQHKKQVDINECDDSLINAKKIRCNASLNVESKKKKAVSPHGKRVLDKSNKKFLLVSEREDCHIDKHAKENLGEGSVEGSHDRRIASNQCKSSSHNEVFHGESHIPFNATMMFQHTSGGEYSQQHEGESTPTEVPLPDEIPHETKDDTEHKVVNIIDESQSKRKIDFQPKEPNAADDKAVADAVDGCGVEISSDSDGHHNETIDLAAKKHEFLSSYCTFGHDISASTRLTENNLCMKCNEVGELLVCKTTTCPIMVHKSCLSTYAQIDAEGNFFCPFCAYCQAISEYLEANKKASLARKELAIFICKDLGHQNTQLLHEVNIKGHSLSRKNRMNEHIQDQHNRNDQLPGTVDNKEDHVCEHEINSLHLERNQQRALTSCANSSCNEKKIVNNGIVEGLSGKGRAEMPSLKCSTSRGVGKKQVPAEHVDDDDNNFSCEEANVLAVNQGNTEEIQKEMLEQHNTVETVEPACVPDSEKEENSKDEDESPIISRSARRFTGHGTKRKPLASPQSRQKQYRGRPRRKS